MKRSIALSAAATMAAALFTACSADQTAAYCEELETAKAELDKLQTGDVESFEQIQDTVAQLSEEAPDAVSEDWKTLDETFGEIQSTLDDAGVSLSDLQDPSSLPEGLDQEKLVTLGEDLQKLDSDQVDKATEDIEKHAKDECDIDLGSDSDSSGE